MKVTSAKQLGACIKDARLSQKLSQGKVAEKVGIRQDTVSSFPPLLGQRGDGSA
jgi:HTH-type transcriptional regulator/antitoxin HipB